MLKKMYNLSYLQDTSSVCNQMYVQPNNGYTWLCGESENCGSCVFRPLAEVNTLPMLISIVRQYEQDRNSSSNTSI